MEYEYLIGHRVKCNFIDIRTGHKNEYLGSVSNVAIDDNNRERVFVIEDNKKLEWFTPNHPDAKNLHIEILDEEYTPFTRFEIMDI